MPKVDIRIAESALADLESIRVWYAEQGVPDVGERLIAEVVTSIEDRSSCYGPNRSGV